MKLTEIIVKNIDMHIKINTHHCVFISLIVLVKPDLAYLADLLNASPGNAVEPPL